MGTRLTGIANTVLGTRLTGIGHATDSNRHASLESAGARAQAAPFSPGRAERFTAALMGKVTHILSEREHFFSEKALARVAVCDSQTPPVSCLVSRVSCLVSQTPPVLRQSRVT